MIVNVKGVGKVNFPDNMSLDQINSILTKTYGSAEKPASVEELAAVVKSVVDSMTEAEPPVVDVKVEPVVPDVKVESPTVEVTNEPADMEPIAKALMSVLSKPQPDINVEIPKRAMAMDIEVVERDTFGNIKRLRMTEVA